MNNRFTKSAILISLLLLVIIGSTLMLRFTQQRDGGSGPLPIPTPYKGESFPEANNLPTPQIFTAEKNLSSTLGQVAFTYSQRSFPTTLSIYRIASYELDTNQANIIAQRLGFSEKADIGLDGRENTIVRYSGDNGNKQLVMILQTGSISYTNDSVPAQQSAGSKEEIEQVARDFITQAGVFPTGSQSLIQTQFYTKNGAELTPTNSFTDATVFHVSFERTLDNRKIYHQYDNANYIGVWIDKTKTVTKASLDFAPIFDSRSASVMTLDQAQQLVQQGKGAVVRLDPVVTGIQPQLQKTTFQEVELGYLDDGKNTFVEPLFIFRGTTQDTQGKTYAISVFLPARQ